MTYFKVSEYLKVPFCQVHFSWVENSWVTAFIPSDPADVLHNLLVFHICSMTFSVLDDSLAFVRLFAFTLSLCYTPWSCSEVFVSFHCLCLALSKVLVIHWLRPVFSRARFHCHLNYRLHVIFAGLFGNVAGSFSIYLLSTYHQLSTALLVGKAHGSTC